MDLKGSILKRMMPPQSRSVAELSGESGITETTLYSWRNTARKTGAVMPGGGRSKAEAWDSASKFAVVVESAGLNEVELSEYCCGKGLFVAQVRSWRTACEQANAERETQTADYARSLKVERRRHKELEQELRRKEKALAEAAALLMRAKKYRALPAADEDV